MRREASLEEGPLLRLIWDYFEQAGHVECLLALENCCKDYTQCSPGHKKGLPLELSALREMALKGRWDQVITYLNAFSSSKDKEGLKRCMYAAQKQKYFEILENVEDNIRSKFRLGFRVPANGGMLSPSEAERTQELIEHQLTALKLLCPSPTKYQSLKDLISLPSFSSSNEFSTWQLHSGRLETFYEIGEWMSKVLYLNSKFPMSRRDTVENKNSCALSRLVAKGFLYEQCEQLCMTRSGESGEQLASPNMLDLGSWIHQQPDSSFQIPPTEICLVLRPLRKSTSSEAQLSHSIDKGRVKGTLNDHLDKSILTLPPFRLLSGSNREEKIMLTGGPQKVGHVSFKVAADLTVEQVDNRRSAKVKMSAGSEGVMSKEELKPPMTSGPKPFQQPFPCVSVSCTFTEPAFSASSQGRKTSEVLVKSRTRDQGVGEEIQDSSLPPPPPNVKQQKSFPMANQVAHLPCITLLTMAHPGGDSTSKDSRISCSSLKTSPQSSQIFLPPPIDPVPSQGLVHTSTSAHDIPTTDFGTYHKPLPAPLSSILTTAPVHGLVDLSTTVHGLPHISKAASFSFGHNNMSNAVSSPVCPDESGRNPATPAILEGGYGAREHVELTSKSCWPSVALLGTVSDSQVVRSIAFSGSGKVVSIGANSRTLRLCYTDALLEKKNSVAVEVFYQHHEHHKSSIYCMAWLNDTLLASGSNDQTIRLLTCSPDHTFKVQKPLLLHKGTVRDLVFTNEGLLVSGGGGSLHVKVTDVKTCQTVQSLAGHTDQILALGVIPGGLVVSGGQDKTVRIWDLRTYLPITSINLSSSASSLTVCVDGLVTAHLDGSCSLHELKSYQCTASYKPHVGECRTVRFCPDRSRSSWVLSGSYDGTVCLAEVNTAVAATTKCVQWTNLCQHKDKVIQCRWHPEGHLFASTGADKKACFWRMH